MYQNNFIKHIYKFLVEQNHIEKTGNINFYVKNKENYTKNINFNNIF